jgi:general transcription factor 3C polypeptide 5 (transcription factor C subunit 1)
MCKLEAMPSQSFIFLQLYELKDDFIQAEIRKPSYQTVCSVSTKTIASRLYFNLFYSEC